MLEVEPSGRRGHRKWLKRAGRSLSFRRHRGDILFHFNHLCNSLQSLIIHKNLKRFENKKNNKSVTSGEARLPSSSLGTPLVDK